MMIRMNYKQEIFDSLERSGRDERFLEFNIAKVDLFGFGHRLDYRIRAHISTNPKKYNPTYEDKPLLVLKFYREGMCKFQTFNPSKLTEPDRVRIYAKLRYFLLAEKT